MKIMVIGGGGREHAIIRRLRENPAVTDIYALPGNAGIAEDATCVKIAATDIDGMVRFAKDNGIEFALLVAPDDPLAMGAVDALHAAGVPCFGPDAKAAQIESSKAFAKNLMKKYGIPTAAFEVFDDAQKALEYVSTVKCPVVVKADGLALGKGVLICQTNAEAEEAVRGDDAGSSLRRQWSEGGRGGIPRGPGGLRAGLHRRKRREAHGFVHGSQALPTTATRVSTPAAWARSRRIPTIQRQSLSAAWMRFSCPPSAR